ncbi:uncharacterized protein LOC136075993 [Hydra vulgaris]|uniref:Uncharacterized protein LOC136075993 n=1 Tax=Hydra vulgaris TaxID=6087 RepID=A0ABM4B9F4_HYDVU
MTGRKEGLYLHVFKKVHELSTILAPQIVMADYEIAIGNPAKAVFPNIRVTGCIFYYAHAIFKKIRAIGLQVEYTRNNNPIIRKWCRKFISMCLFPPNLVRPEVDKLKAEANHHSVIAVKQKMKKFVQYYERYWMLQRSLEMFSVHGPRYRTNNVSKSLHSKMSRSMTAHPGF